MKNAFAAYLETNFLNGFSTEAYIYGLKNPVRSHFWQIILTPNWGYTSDKWSDPLNKFYRNFNAAVTAFIICAGNFYQ